MKSINLYAYNMANKSINSELFKNYTQVELGIEQKEKETNDIVCFIDKLLEYDIELSLLDHFYIGYCIPQISKEFDLLRICENYIVNIELKNKNTGDKIKNQLIQNQYYLNSTGKEYHCFTYVVSEEKLYKIINDNLVECDFSNLLDILRRQVNFNKINLNEMFDPIQYLISPFNTTDKFLSNNYFLTDQQQNFKKEIINLISNTKQYLFLGITGGPGTGKTLLTYDLVKYYKNTTNNIVILHCGIINKGQKTLKRNDFNIKNMSEYEKVIDQNRIIIVDEAQRMKGEQFKTLINKIKEQNKICIFSYDQNQTLSNAEIQNNIKKKISSIITKDFILSSKIRTNPETSSFIKNIFNLSKKNTNYSYSNIDTFHFNTLSNAIEFIKYQQKEKSFTFINYTGTMHYENPKLIQSLEKFKNYNAHEVIGQEFDNVLVVIDDTFGYSNEKELYSNGWTNVKYNANKMLFQAISRVRKKLCIVVINNSAVFEQLIKIKQG